MMTQWQVRSLSKYLTGGGGRRCGGHLLCGDPQLEVEEVGLLESSCKEKTPTWDDK